MSISRRRTLALIGGGTILAAGGLTTGFLTTREPEAARRPWAVAGDYEEIRHYALSYAILAPNPHNRQPWLVELGDENDIRLWRDLERDLPVTDPEARQLTIGLGCFLETLVIAAANRGFNAKIDLFPDGEDGPVAAIELEQGAEPDPLFAQIIHRRSTKEPFELRSIPNDMQGALSEHATIIQDEQTVAKLRELTWQAWKIEAETHAAYLESVELMRLGKAEIEANPDGIDIGGPFLESLMLMGMMSREQLADTTSTAYQEGFNIYREMLAATPAYAVIKTAANTRIDQIAAGRQWQRLNLKTTGFGLALHPVSQCLQEYPEMAGPFAEVHRQLAPEGDTVQMLGRLGYGPKTPPAPRWPLETRITHG